MENAQFTACRRREPISWLTCLSLTWLASRFLCSLADEQPIRFPYVPVRKTLELRMLAHSSPGVWALRGSPGGRARARCGPSRRWPRRRRSRSGTTSTCPLGCGEVRFLTVIFLTKLLAFWQNLANLMLRNNEKCDIRSVNGGVTTIAADRLEDLASGKIDVINGAEGSRPRASPVRGPRRC